MDKISATTAHSSAHHASSASRAHKANEPDKTSRQMTENKVVEAKLERNAQTKKMIDSRPSPAHLKFQASLRSTGT
ncbi:hypothetical protein AO398_09710 [Methylobacterium sp. GXS13]|uniref:hypothetical protein n=1 Tax=Methylobacterium sp. GXS13 TaxID=1730094 RepID=UPI00071BA935|nr:hypothetical protein [Methylobacterium sp. GXS13]KST56842.1 hypothetical protein AO398_09710 [Methylobacterium sp. GXS13]